MTGAAATSCVSDSAGSAAAASAPSFRVTRRELCARPVSFRERASRRETASTYVFAALASVGANARNRCPAVAVSLRLADFRRRLSTGTAASPSAASSPRPAHARLVCPPVDDARLQTQTPSGSVERLDRVGRVERVRHEAAGRRINGRLPFWRATPRFRSKTRSRRGFAAHVHRGHLLRQRPWPIDRHAHPRDPPLMGTRRCHGRGRHDRWIARIAWRRLTATQPIGASRRRARARRAQRARACSPTIARGRNARTSDSDCRTTRAASTAPHARQAKNRFRFRRFPPFFFDDASPTSACAAFPYGSPRN